MNLIRETYLFSINLDLQLSLNAYKDDKKLFVDDRVHVRRFIDPSNKESIFYSKEMCKSLKRKFGPLWLKLILEPEEFNLNEE